MFLYVPAEQGQGWIDRLKAEAKKDGVGTSEFVRECIDPFLSSNLRKKVRAESKKRGMSVSEFLRWVLDNR